MTLPALLAEIKKASFTIRWDAEQGKYFVSIPEYDGGEVVPKELATQLAAIAEELEKNATELRSLLARETIQSDSYGLEGSDFCICPFCDAESGAGVLNKGIPHEPGCILHGDSNVCESVVEMAEQRRAAQLEAKCLKTERDEAQAELERLRAQHACDQKTIEELREWHGKAPVDNGVDTARAIAGAMDGILNSDPSKSNES